MNRDILNIQKRFELSNIERNAKLKAQEESIKGTIAMAITANHHLNQPLTILQVSMDLIIDKLEKEKIEIDKTAIVKTQEMMENIRATLIKFRRNI